jgi:hypothetical protein
MMNIVKCSGIQQCADNFFAHTLVFIPLRLFLIRNDMQKRKACSSIELHAPLLLTELS